jgi:exodeoxyribonuclease VII large subunit
MQQKGLEFGDVPERGAEPASRPRVETRKQPEPAPAPRRAWTVSQLTARLQGVLETEFFDVWVEGEISNLKLAGSGHWYFSLKDESAQIRAVVWKAAARLIRFKPKDGLKVVARGSLRVYPPRGEYQLSVEVLEPLGKGSLQQAFEELKEKLEKEGLFDAKRKRPLPMLPRRIGVVTSPSGAVVRDILRILRRRYRNLEVLIYPARVQGEGAAAEIVQGIRALNQISGLDVLVVARGGGSLEDLWPFNEERVARALAASRVPTISAVGHETDFTIADFVADLRVPTPSAAAERVVQAKEELASRIAQAAARATAAMQHRMTRVRARVSALTSHRVFAAEQGRIRNHAQRVDELALRAERGLRRHAERARARSAALGQRLDAFRIDRQLAARRERLGRHAERLLDLARSGLARRRAALGTAAGKLDSLSPLGVLSRGYALVWAERSGRLLRSAAEVERGEALRVRVREGQLTATVTGKEPAP